MDKDFEVKREKMNAAIADFYSYCRLEMEMSVNQVVDLVSRNAEAAIRLEEAQISDIT